MITLVKPPQHALAILRPKQTKYNALDAVIYPMHGDFPRGLETRIHVRFKILSPFVNSVPFSAKPP